MNWICTSKHLCNIAIVMARGNMYSILGCELEVVYYELYNSKKE